MCNLVLEHMRSVYTNLNELDSFSKEKCALIYNVIEEANSQFYCPVEREFRSRMNVIFKGHREADERAFLQLSERAGMIQLKGHRSVGGLRASLYNAVSFEECEQLAALFKVVINRNDEITKTFKKFNS